MRIILLLITISVLLFPVPAFAADVPEEPVGLFNEPESAQPVSANYDPTMAEALSDLYDVIDGLRRELAERDQTEPPTERPTQPETTADRSAPRLMVTDYSIDTGFLSPGTQGKLTVNLTNTNRKRAVSNLKLTLTDDSGELTQEGMNTRYVGGLDAGKTYVLEVLLTASHSAAVGRHSLTLTAEYEDADFQSYSASDTLCVEVRQPARLSFDGAVLPAKTVQGDTVTVTVNLMNTGKSALYNCKVDFAVEGLSSGGSAFAGELAAGESRPASANLRVSSEKTGKVKGRITVSYEDAYGKPYTQSADVETVIEKKVKAAAAPQTETKKNNPWWLFLCAGAAAGAVPALAVPAAIRAARQRNEDEKRL